MRRTQLLFICLAVTVVLTGCIGPDNGSSDEPANNTVTPAEGTGLDMTFRPAEETYLEGEPIVLELHLANRGEGMARNIQTRLFDTSFIVGAQPERSGATELRGVDTVQNRSGEETAYLWRIDNPVNLEQGVTDSFPAGIMVQYDYETTAETTVTFVSDRRYDGESEQATTETTAGPIDVQFDMDTPQPVYADEDDNRTWIQARVRLKNVGDGALKDITEEQQDVRIRDARFVAADSAELSCPESVTVVGGDRLFTCEAYVPSDIVQQQLTMQLELAYTYTEEASTTFNVEGIR